MAVPPQEEGTEQEYVKEEMPKEQTVIEDELQTIQNEDGTKTNKALEDLNIVYEKPVFEEFKEEISPIKSVPNNIVKPSDTMSEAL